MDFGVLTSRIVGYFRPHPTKATAASRQSQFHPGDEVERWLCTYARTINKSLKLLSYDIQKLVKWGALPSMFVQGTIFTMDNTLWHTLLHQGVIACIAGSTTLWDPSFSEKDTQGVNDLSQYLGSFTPFALGMYISLCLRRWWSLRTDALSPVYNATANVCMLLLGALPNVHRYNQLKDQVLKYGICSVRLMVLAARDQDDIGEMEDIGLLDAEERDIVQSMSLFPRAMIMWAWIMRLSFHAFEECKIPLGVFNNVVKECIAARNGIQTIHTYCKTQVPLAYVHLILLIVNLNNIVVSVKSGLLIALAIRNYCNGDAQGKDFWQIIVNLTFWLTVPIIYQGLLAISYVVHDPFGEDILDFPVANFSDYVFRNCEAMYTTGHCPSEHEIFSNSSRVQEVIQEMNQLGFTASSSMKATLASWEHKLARPRPEMTTSLESTQFPLVDASLAVSDTPSMATRSSKRTSFKSTATLLEEETPEEIAEEFVIVQFMPMIRGLTSLLQDLDSKLPDARTAKEARDRTEKQRSLMTQLRSYNDAERQKLRVILENERKNKVEGASACATIEICQSSEMARPKASDAVKENYVETCSF